MATDNRRMPKLHIGIEVLAVIAQLLFEKVRKLALIATLKLMGASND